MTLSLDRSFGIQSSAAASRASAIRAELRDRKETPETVHVLERHWGEWKITQESAPHKKLDSETAEWALTLAAGQTMTLEYTVETYWP